MSRSDDLSRRRKDLVARSEAERSEIDELVLRVTRPLAWIDTGSAALGRLLDRPWAAGIGSAALLFARPAKVLRIGGIVLDVALLALRLRSAILRSRDAAAAAPDV